MPTEERTVSQGERILTKRQIKRRYLRAEIGLSDAIPELMFDHSMMYGEALRYLMREPAHGK